MDLSFLSTLIDSGKIGGWVRSIVGAGFVMLVAKYPVLGTLIPPDAQVQIAGALAIIVIGGWSTLTKTDEAKVKAAAAIVDPETGKKTVVITTPALAAATPETNIVSNKDIAIVSKETP